MTRISYHLRSRCYHILFCGCVCILGGTSDVWATCGDYLMDAHEVKAWRESELDSGSANQFGHGSMSEQDTNDPVPCHGPGCRGGQPHPLPSAPLSIERQADDACLALVGIRFRPEVSWLELSQFPVFASADCEPLERPPRQISCR